MFKILFFDNWGLEILQNFKRRLNRPVKHPANPILLPDKPWEENNLQTFGSVIKLPGRPFQLWYTINQHDPWNLCLAYAESDDGLTWRKPELDLIKKNGENTNLLLDCDPHGAAVVHDPVSDSYRLIAGISPTECISVFSSKDGIHWAPLNQGPAIPNKPDCAMGLIRTRSGQYAAYHRHPSTGRRVCRTTSWDFRFWESKPQMVFEPDVNDPPQLQFYALGSANYGSYELGTLWTYHTYADDLASWHFEGHQQAELAYSRNGICWHRAAQGQPFLPRGNPGGWDSENLQCCSQPVYLDDEIRYYFTGTTRRHATRWVEPPDGPMGLGMASIKPDRFIALEAGARQGELLTWAASLPGPRLFVNAQIAPRGSLALELLESDGKPIPGYSAQDMRPLSGDSTAHELAWSGQGNPNTLKGKAVRFRILATHAKLYSVFGHAAEEKPVYHQFYAPY